VCRTLSLPLDAEPFVSDVGAELDAAYGRTAENLSGNESVDVEREHGRDRLRISPLDRLAEPGSLITLRQTLAALMPKVDLPEVLLEVAAWTGFDAEFTHVSESGPRVEDLRTIICAVLLAEACNLGLEPVCRADRPALSRGRLAWVAQNYLRVDTLTRANCRLVDYQAGIALARRWGGGEVASADGLRFAVPVHSVHAGLNRRYFGAGRGVTYYNFSSDQFTGFHATVIPGTLRDSMFILDGLLDNLTSLEPTEIMADTAGYSDVVFGLFRLLGYQFSPRMADAGDARFWRIDPTTSYGPLSGIARHRIDVRLVARHWDDILRLARSLATRAVNASQLTRTLHRGPRASTLARAVGEVGRISKTLYLLAYIDDEDYHGASSPSSTGARAAMPWPDGSSTVSKANYASPTGKAKKISSAASAWSSMPSSCGTPATSTGPSTTQPRPHARDRGHCPRLTAGLRPHQPARSLPVHLDEPAAHGQLRALPNSA
jgi:TnpA family transposase